MRVEKVSFGHIILLMPEEQTKPAVIETIAKLKETSKVVIFISGSESTSDLMSGLMKNRISQIN